MFLGLKSPDSGVVVLRVSGWKVTSKEPKRLGNTFEINIKRSRVTIKFFFWVSIDLITMIQLLGLDYQAGYSM